MLQIRELLLVQCLGFPFITWSVAYCKLPLILLIARFFPWINNKLFPEFTIYFYKFSGGRECVLCSHSKLHMTRNGIKFKICLSCLLQAKVIQLICSQSVLYDKAGIPSIYLLLQCCPVDFVSNRRWVSFL